MLEEGVGETEMVASAAELLTGYAGNYVRTILVVEDEEAIRECVADFLRDSGFRVLVAADVPEAREILLGQAVDLVFSDINMPRSETGFALEKWVRRHYPQISVLLTSGCPQLAKDTMDLREPLILKPYRYAD